MYFYTYSKKNMYVCNYYSKMTYAEENQSLDNDIVPFFGGKGTAK